MNDPHPQAITHSTLQGTSRSANIRVSAGVSLIAYSFSDALSNSKTMQGQTVSELEMSKNVKEVTA